MGQIKRIIVYGNTLVLAGIEASIALDPDCEVIGHAMTSNQQELNDLHPDVLIFDLDAEQPEFRTILAKELPGLLVIGIDPDSNQVVLWSGQHLSELTSEELVNVIRQKDSIHTENLKGEQHEKNNQST